MDHYTALPPDTRRAATEGARSEAANVVIMSDYIARLRDEGKIQRRGFFFSYHHEAAPVIDLTARRLERIRRQYC